MKPNMLHLDSELASQLGECEAGETKTITLTLKVTGMKDGLTGEVQSVEPYEEEDEDEEDEDEEDDEEEDEAPSAKRPKAVDKALKY